MAIWGSQSVQFVWFVTSPDGLVASNLYELLIGQHPDNFQRNKTLSPATPFFSQASGDIDDIEYVIQVNPGRVDFVMSRATGGQPLSGIPLLDTKKEIETTLKRFEQVGANWPDAIRLSIIANLLLPVPDFKSANKHFFETTGIDLAIGDVTDTFLQINRRKQISDSLAINRIMRFGTLVIQQFAMDIFPGGASPGNPFPVSAQQFATSLTLDFNSNPDGRIFKVAEQVTICHKLAEELLRVAEIGSPKALAE